MQKSDATANKKFQVNFKPNLGDSIYVPTLQAQVGVLYVSKPDTSFVWQIHAWTSLNLEKASGASSECAIGGTVKCQKRLDGISSQHICCGLQIHLTFTSVLQLRHRSRTAFFYFISSRSEFGGQRPAAIRPTPG